MKVCLKHEKSAQQTFSNKIYTNSKHLTFTGGGTHIISVFENLTEVAIFAGVNPELTGCLLFAAYLSEQHDQEAD